MWEVKKWRAVVTSCAYSDHALYSELYIFCDKRGTKKGQWTYILSNENIAFRLNRNNYASQSLQWVGELGHVLASQKHKNHACYCKEGE